MYSRGKAARLQQVGELLGIDLLDHIVIGRGRPLSFFCQGRLLAFSWTATIAIRAGTGCGTGDYDRKSSETMEREFKAKKHFV